MRTYYLKLVSCFRDSLELQKFLIFVLHIHQLG